MHSKEWLHVQFLFYFNPNKKNSVAQQMCDECHIQRLIWHYTHDNILQNERIKQIMLHAQLGIEFQMINMRFRSGFSLFLLCEPSFGLRCFLGWILRSKETRTQNCVYFCVAKRHQHTANKWSIKKCKPQKI